MYLFSKSVLTFSQGAQKKRQEQIIIFSQNTLQGPISVGKKVKNFLKHTFFLLFISIHTKVLDNNNSELIYNFYDTPYCVGPQAWSRSGAPAARRSMSDGLPQCVRCPWGGSGVGRFENQKNGFLPQLKWIPWMLTKFSTSVYSDIVFGEKPHWKMKKRILPGH